MSYELEMAQRMGLSSAREYKALKRAQVKAVERALEDLYLGCAASPAHREIDSIRLLVKTIRQKQSAKAWGR